MSGAHACESVRSAFYAHTKMSTQLRDGLLFLGEEMVEGDTSRPGDIQCYEDDKVEKCCFALAYRAAMNGHEGHSHGHYHGYQSQSLEETQHYGRRTCQFGENSQAHSHSAAQSYRVGESAGCQLVEIAQFGPSVRHQHSSEAHTHHEDAERGPSRAYFVLREEKRAYLHIIIGAVPRLLLFFSHK